MAEMLPQCQNLKGQVDSLKQISQQEASLVSCNVVSTQTFLRNIISPKFEVVLRFLTKVIIQQKDTANKSELRKQLKVLILLPLRSLINHQHIHAIYSQGILGYSPRRYNSAFFKQIGYYCKHIYSLRTTSIGDMTGTETQSEQILQWNSKNKNKGIQIIRTSRFMLS